MNQAMSLQQRAVIAVILTIGFYLMALAIALGLLFIPYAEWTYGGRLHIKLAVLCVAGGLVILWSVLPKGGTFTKPGPQLTREKEPALFAELENVARTADQEMPAEVYLVPDLNAWVSQRGGFMGIGGKRIMGLGLPLMRVLKVPEFRAVLAHEFGHYHSGDTKLGPWVFQTHGAIGRTLQSLDGDGVWESILRFPFLTYGKLFLRITHAISRRQEFVADALAARTVGAAPLISGLRTIQEAGPVFNAYWQNEYVPLLTQGYRAPLVAGFAAFSQAAAVKAAIHQQLEEEKSATQANPYDTHPPMQDRIAALAQFPDTPVPRDSLIAESLLADAAAYEDDLLRAMIEGSTGAPEALPGLKPVTWSEVARQVHLPLWEKFVVANVKTLAGVTPEALPELLDVFEPFARRVVASDGSPIPPEHAAPAAVQLLGAALTVLLVARGGAVESLPGRPVNVRLAHATLETFNVIGPLARKTLSPDDWRQTCRDLGIAGATLETEAPPVPAELAQQGHS